MFPLQLWQFWEGNHDAWPMESNEFSLSESFSQFSVEVPWQVICSLTLAPLREDCTTCNVWAQKSAPNITEKCPSCSWQKRTFINPAGLFPPGKASSWTNCGRFSLFQDDCSRMEPCNWRTQNIFFQTASDIQLIIQRNPLLKPVLFGGASMWVRWIDFPRPWTFKAWWSVTEFGRWSGRGLGGLGINLWGGMVDVAPLSRVGFAAWCQCEVCVCHWIGSGKKCGWGQGFYLPSFGAPVYDKPIPGASHIFMPCWQK